MALKRSRSSNYKKVSKRVTRKGKGGKKITYTTTVYKKKKGK